MIGSTKDIYSGFPLIRMRRNRMKDFSRKMISENNLFVSDLIQPLFVTRGKLENSMITSMPGILCLSPKNPTTFALYNFLILLLFLFVNNVFITCL